MCAERPNDKTEPNRSPLRALRLAHPLARAVAYSLVLPARLALAQRAFASNEILALAALLMVRLAFLTGFTGNVSTGSCVPFSFAHRARCAAAIFAFTAALLFRFIFGSAEAAGVAGVVEDPTTWPSSCSSASIWSFKSAARRSCFDVRFVMLFIYWILGVFSP